MISNTLHQPSFIIVRQRSSNTLWKTSHSPPLFFCFSISSPFNQKIANRIWGALKRIVFPMVFEVFGDLFDIHCCVPILLMLILGNHGLKAPNGHGQPIYFDFEGEFLITDKCQNNLRYLQMIPNISKLSLDIFTSSNNYKYYCNAMFMHYVKRYFPKDKVSKIPPQMT